MINAGTPWQDGGCPKKPRQPEPSGGNSKKSHEILPSYYHSLCTSRFGNSWSPLNKKPSYCQRGKHVYEKITEIYIPPELQPFSRDSTKACYLVDQIQLTHWYWKQPTIRIITTELRCFNPSVYEVGQFSGPKDCSNIERMTSIPKLDQLGTIQLITKISSRWFKTWSLFIPESLEVTWTQNWQPERYSLNTVDGWNPANQLRLVVYPIIYKVSKTSQVFVWNFVHQQ